MCIACETCDGGGVVGHVEPTRSVGRSIDRSRGRSVARSSGRSVCVGVVRSRERWWRPTDRRRAGPSDGDARASARDARDAMRRTSRSCVVCVCVLCVLCV